MITDFFIKCLFNLILNSLNILMSEFHFSHSWFVNFSTFHDLDLGFKIFLFFMEVSLIFILWVEEDFAFFELLLVFRFLLYNGDFLLLISLNGLFKFIQSSFKFLLVIEIHRLPIKISILLNFYKKVKFQSNQINLIHQKSTR